MKLIVLTALINLSYSVIEAINLTVRVVKTDVHKWYDGPLQL